MAELLIVVAIIAVLVAVAIPTFSNQLEKSRQAVDISALRQAYAVARIAEMDQAVDGVRIEKLGAGVGGDGEGPNADSEYALYWYIPDTGTLKRAEDRETAAAAGAVSGKARGTKVLVDTDSLGTAIKYSQLPASGGTTESGIVVVFRKKSDSGYFTLDRLFFEKNATTYQDTGSGAVGESEDDGYKREASSYVTTVNAYLSEHYEDYFSDPDRNWSWSSLSVSEKIAFIENHLPDDSKRTWQRLSAKQKEGIVNQIKDGNIELPIGSQGDDEEG